ATDKKDRARLAIAKAETKCGMPHSVVMLPSVKDDDQLTAMFLAVLLFTRIHGAMSARVVAGDSRIP
ncbi:hypothetical protein KIPB_014637, partial [Kipferlia bialata]